MSTLGDLIREGTGLAPEQAFGEFYDSQTHAACALSTAVLAQRRRDGKKQLPHTSWAQAIFTLMQRLDHTGLTHYYNCHTDDCTFGSHTLRVMLFHWNDGHRLTREEIADRVDHLERYQR